ncbi:hypothetical protein HBI56_232910 [Parastagonospora nodorum]|uniref:Uncharacterized protein n=1 Tax=Phaeosphaeria nodorum (strain SN15 / ATCC MYA-4574 / FGSC 10173) TaxID=321614 RepID=A0A7U2F8P9_PHANO|nr:hypothetical protein HBH56_200810 [Parastagonospora nodorum]QRD00809.1 hypothetical protein JI435_438620 [Parastagonospora nodorum SN15]KAH3925793.1 hypothetical protein HBH54_175490 [Parastagonospora nodorum]KAH4051810.1 hypothetical protein HBH49_108290 [Parastagonospora nodorum]KAH4132449.1 hypothetical protein HBH45_179200 [Parastagonospora nodorum]
MGAKMVTRTWDFLEMSPGWCLDGRPLKQQLRSRTTDTGPQQFWKRLRWWYDPSQRKSSPILAEHPLDHPGARYPTMECVLYCGKVCRSEWVLSLPYYSSWSARKKDAPLGFQHHC